MIALFLPNLQCDLYIFLVIIFFANFAYLLKDCYTHLMDWIKKNHIILATCSVIVAALQVNLKMKGCIYNSR